MFPYAVAAVLLIILGFVLFACYSNNLQTEDKSMAATLTTGFAAACLAVLAFGSVQQQIGIARQQANVVMAEDIDRRRSYLDEILSRLVKMQTALATSGVENLSPVPFGLDNPDRSHAMPEKYQELKSKIESLWAENDKLEALLVQMRPGATKDSVNDFISHVNGVKTVSSFLIRHLDAMVEFGPNGGFAALRYDLDNFNKMRASMSDLLNKAIFEKFFSAKGAIDAEEKVLTTRLRIIDQSFQ
jgi:hypothetical protein